MPNPESTKYKEELAPVIKLGEAYYDAVTALMRRKGYVPPGLKTALFVLADAVRVALSRLRPYEK